MTSMLSNSWYRVAALKPKLRSHARLHRHRYRGQVWYLLQDPASNRVHRFTSGARLIIAGMDGRRTVNDLWEMADRKLGEEAPTQDEIISLLGQLHAADLLQSDVTPDTSEIFDRGERQEKALRRRSFMNPMAVRVPLWDPNVFLDYIQPLVRFVWSKWGALVWLSVVLPALVLLPPHWGELSNNFSDRVLAVDNLLLLWLVFPVIKALHELGHATAVKSGSGEVHDMGIIFLVLIPVPYVEASAASVFRSKYERAIVGAAGILVELFIAALAFYLWLLAEPGVGRAILFNIIFIAGVSTLLFNGNPLLRYDAYYILADLIEVPNLAKRSLSYWEYVVKRYMFGMRETKHPENSRSEKLWFLFYGIASSIYRVLVTIAIAIFIAGEFFVIGVVLAIWAVAVMAFVPLFKGVQQILASASVQKHRRRVLSVVAGILGGVVVLLFVLPMPFRSIAEGVIWLPEQALVRSGVSGFLVQFLATPGAKVEVGDELLKLQDPVLEAELRTSEARVTELEAIYSAEFIVDRAKAEIARRQLESEKVALNRVREKAHGLVVHATASGTFVVPQAIDMVGQYYRKGDLLGYVIESGSNLARVVVAQNLADLVRQSTEEIRVRLVHRPDIVAEGKIIREIPLGEEHLPSKALGTEGGGGISIDPRDQKGTKSMERMFQFEIELTQDANAAFFGERVYIRFDHKKEPLAYQWFRGIRSLFLSQFNV